MKELKEIIKEKKEILDPKTRVIGTIEPDWVNEREFVGDGIKDDALAFIYGAIKKYGSDPKCYNDLKKYISMMVERIGEKNV